MVPEPSFLLAAKESSEQGIERARAAFQRGDGLATLRDLPLDITRLPAGDAAAALGIQAQAELLLGRTLDAIATVNRLRELSPTDAALAETTLRQHLLALDQRTLKELYRRSHQPSTRSWISPMLGTAGTEPARVTQLPPVAHTAISAPAKVAVLLPFGGRYSSAAASILAGVKAAHASHHGANSVGLVILDTGPDDSAALERYQEAVRANTDRVIGPLTREAIGNLAHNPDLPIPLVALNEIEPGTIHANRLFTIALDPESEARQLAAEALAAGYRSVWILAADTALGTRLERAFSQAFESGGGTVARRITLAAAETDFLGPLATLSRAVPRANESLVFLAMPPEQARMVWPQLRYLGHGHRTVWATSHIFAGYPDPRLDSDLDGLRFLDMPGLIDGRVTTRMRGGGTDEVWPRLFALGHDAFQVALQLGDLARFGTEFAGLSGTLRIRPDRRVERSLSWAQIVDGKPKPEAEGFVLRPGKDRPIP